MVVRRPLRPGCHLGSGCIILLYGISFFDDPLFPHGFFLGLGLGLWFKKGLPELTYCRKQHSLRCPPLRTALPVNLFFCLIFASFQAVAYHMPFITHSWLFNEVLGFAPGIGMGWLWGRGLAMLFDIPTRGQQVYKDI